MRSKTGIIRRKRHKKVLKKTKGFRMSKSRLFTMAKEALLHADQYSYHGRKLRKRDFRRLWIQRINAALKEMNIKYSQTINKLNKNKIQLDRKILADLTINHPKHFKNIIDKIK